MIRKRIPQKDDKTIWSLIVLLLLPYARLTHPNLRVNIAYVRHRLHRCTTFVAVNGRRAPSGFIALRPEKKTMFIDMLAVHPRFQGKGIGTRLLEHAERVALQAGYEDVSLWVDESNRSAQQFYVAKQYEPFHYDRTIKCYLLVKQLQNRRF
ncbi:GNAT family N-acetyltransferase [Paenibacillus piri]|uniref:GNAT family N-acetyltransferase n=1 Tax=Paenibacillus piri TaxID=2547395 RepID=A0A4R5KA10_9BACL|nr:GNAT family N-acetyltransferase [Paenibacillus piri]TDF91846.1 GNAT family N-acetyltransferase [Paenibacillus piri]